MSIRVLIVEDESAAVKNLVSILQEIDSNIEIVGVIESIKDLFNWLSINNPPDLGFFDIQLTDGNVFDIFKKIQIGFPIIFTTAYSEYAINAFKVNGIDYILKPINIDAVRFGINKYKSMGKFNERVSEEKLLNILSQLNRATETEYKHSFLIHYKDRLIPVETNSFAYFFIESKIVYGITFDKKRYTIDYTLEELESVINSKHFIRVNRQFIINRKSISEIALYFNSRYHIKVKPITQTKIITSKTRSVKFKNWLDT